MFQTGVKRKVPITIYPTQDIYAFPTHSPTHFDYHWLFYTHIQSMT
ncbi:hypothetical protein CR203_06120 [Salipaludibacillus neizhouensis]|uniref:Uncharacterized protein n=1 Tax=Salipaludibacillus neizhouensis TaxID=885475 RepID=A0A3A9KBD9_9BACI|nr:hypothetical protein CR203_06120 [Salipaludibacillus neizhouensis]